MTTGIPVIIPISRNNGNYLKKLPIIFYKCKTKITYNNAIFHKLSEVIIPMMIY